MLRCNIQRDFITIWELDRLLRRHEINDMSEVELAFIEPGDAMSIVRRSEAAVQAGMPAKRNFRNHLTIMRHFAPPRRPRGEFRYGVAPGAIKGWGGLLATADRRDNSLQV